VQRGVGLYSVLYGTGRIMIPLYKILIKPILENGNVVWSPKSIKDIHLLENLQRRNTKIIIGTDDKEYEERLRFLKLPSLEYRRSRGDMIETYKITNGMCDSRSSLLNLFSLSAMFPSTRGHN
jgi:hypothetical protein